MNAAFRNFGLVCENKSNRTVRLSSNFQGSKNVLSSRHAFQMVDTIPAKTQQLIAIFTRKMFSNDVQIGKIVSMIVSLQCVVPFPSSISGEFCLLTQSDGEQLFHQGVG